VNHIGASLKDLGKKLFASSKMEIDADLFESTLKLKNQEKLIYLFSFVQKIITIIC